MFWDVSLDKQPINDKPNNTHSPRKKEEGDTEETAKRRREIQTIRVKITLSCMYKRQDKCVHAYILYYNLINIRNDANKKEPK